MPKILLATRIDAPIETVFDLSRNIDAHVESTPGTKEKAVAGRTTGLIELGETVTWEARHFGIRQRLTSKITEFTYPIYFVDEMVDGIFEMIRHEHHFESFEGGTLMKDEFEFRAPLGILGRIAERLILTRYLEKFLIQRNSILKEMAESVHSEEPDTSTDTGF